MHLCTTTTKYVLLFNNQHIFEYFFFHSSNKLHENTDIDIQEIIEVPFFRDIYLYYSLQQFRIRFKIQNKKGSTLLHTALSK